MLSENVRGKFDVIVVGAGPAGSTSAYLLAKKGFKVLLIERGRQAGSKELYGGRVYVEPLKEVWPELEKEAPIHRWVMKERFSILSKDRVLTLEYSYPKPTSFTSYLTELARWMASKAEEAGAYLIDEIVVDEIVLENGRVRGIRSGPDKVYADVVIDAEGANRLLLEKLGLARRPDPKSLALGIKEVLKVDKDKIERSFGLDENEGLAWILMGDVTNGIPGGGFIYTFKDSISLGVVINLGWAIEYIKKDYLKEHVYKLVENLRLHRHFIKYWKDADIMEYGAHLTIESGLSYMPRKLVLPGLLVVGDAAGLLLNTGYTIRGVDFAVYSGKLAAEAIEYALGQPEGPTEDNLSVYVKKLKESFIYKELIRHQGISKIMEDKKLFTALQRLPISLMSKLYEFDKFIPTLNEALKTSLKENELGLLSLILKLWGVSRSL